MPATYYNVFTAIGLAKLAAWQAGGDPLQLSTICVGTGGGDGFYDTYDKQALEGLTTLVDEQWSGSLDSLTTHPENPNWIVPEGTVPAEEGDYIIREVGVKDASGDLVIVGRFPPTPKTAPASGATQAIPLQPMVAVDNVEAVELAVDPDITKASVAYVDARTVRADSETALAGQDSDQISTPLTVRQQIDSRRFFTGGFVAVHNADHPRFVARGPDLTREYALPRLPFVIRRVEFAPDGSHVAVGTATAGGGASGANLRIFRATDFTQIQDVPVVPGEPRDLAHSPDGSYLAVVIHSTSGNALTVIDVASMTTVSGAPSLSQAGRAVAFSPDSSLMAVGLAGSPWLRIFNTDDWSEVTGLPSLPGTVRSIAFSPDGSYMAVSCAEFSPPASEMVVIDTSDWSVVTGTPAIDPPVSMHFSPDGAFLAVCFEGSADLTIIDTSDWSVESGTPTLSNNGSYLRYSPRGELLAVAVQGAPVVEVFDTNDWSLVTDLGLSSGIGRSVAWTPLVW